MAVLRSISQVAIGSRLSIIGINAAHYVVKETL